MTRTKKTCHHLLYPKPVVLIPPFKLKHLGELGCPSHSLMTTPSTEPSSLPLQEYETMSNATTCTSSRLKRSSKSAGLFNTEGPPTTTKKPRYSLPSWTTSEGWNWERRQIPLHHHHPLTSPFQHQPYRATHKSRPVPHPPMPESVQWPTDRLCPSCRVPVDHGVQGLKLVTWELEYRLFQKVFESEPSCCLLARQEEPKHRLPWVSISIVGSTMYPASLLTTGGGAFRRETQGKSWGRTLMLLASFPEITHSMGDRCMRSLTTIKEIVHGTHRTTSSNLSTALTTLTGLSLPSNILATYCSPLRLRTTTKPLASSSNTKKKYAKSKSGCGKLASSKTLVGIGLKGPTLCIGLKRHWWIWIAGRGYVMGILGARNMGIPSEKGVMLWNNT